MISYYRHAKYAATLGEAQAALVANDYKSK
jgi:hypothetical protein